MTTKELILIESLKLFALNGYSAVYVGDIAKNVGIKTPSLYKHYKNKQEIFDSCVDYFYKRMMDMRNSLNMPDSDNPKVSYVNASQKDIINVAIGLFEFYLCDPVASKFRKMLLIERYNNPKLNSLYEDLFINGALAYEESIFTNLVNNKILKDINPHILALRFYSPIYYLLQKYDVNNDIEKARIELSLMVKEFCEVYGNNEK